MGGGGGGTVWRGPNLVVAVAAVVVVAVVAQGQGSELGREKGQEPGPEMETGAGQRPKQMVQFPPHRHPRNRPMPGWQS